MDIYSIIILPLVLIGLNIIFYILKQYSKILLITNIIGILVMLLLCFAGFTNHFKPSITFIFIVETFALVMITHWFATNSDKLNSYEKSKHEKQLNQILINEQELEKTNQEIEKANQELEKANQELERIKLENEKAKIENEKIIIQSEIDQMEKDNALVICSYCGAKNKAKDTHCCVCKALLTVDESSNSTQESPKSNNKK